MNNHPSTHAAQRKGQAARRKGQAGKLLALAMLAASAAIAPAHAGSIIEEWSQAKMPPAPPELKPVTVDAATTALLVLDFSGVEDPTKGPCSTQRGGRCIATIPAMKALIASARAKNMLIVYSVSPTGNPTDIALELKPNAADPVVKASADKFVGTDLGKILADKGIKTVIVTGTSSEGAVLDTATNAVFRGLKAIVPVDGMSSSDLYSEQYVAWHLTHAPGVSTSTTLTRIGLIGF